LNGRKFLAAGLNTGSQESNGCFTAETAITTIAARWASVLLVEQNARKALSVSHRGYVPELGQNRLTGTGRDLLASTEVQRLYLG
jgi:ABC-type branched-subunit amino acid transport system ATPase component